MLDVSLRLGVLDLLAELQREENLGLLYITHDLATARHFSDHVMVMFDGEVVEEGPPDDVILRPQAEFTKWLVAAAPDRPQRAFHRRRRTPAAPHGRTVSPHIGVVSSIGSERHSVKSSSDGSSAASMMPSG